MTFFFLKYRTQFGCEEWVLRVNYYFIYIHTYVYIYIFIFIFGICICSRASQLKLYSWIITGFSPVLFMFPLHCCCSVALFCLSLCDPMNCSTPGFPVLHHLLEFVHSFTLNQWCHPTISSSVSHYSCLQFFPASGSFPVNWIFISGDQSIELQFQHQSFQPIFREDLF